MVRLNHKISARFVLCLALLSAGVHAVPLDNSLSALSGAALPLVLTGMEYRALNLFVSQRLTEAAGQKGLDEVADLLRRARQSADTGQPAQALTVLNQAMARLDGMALPDVERRRFQSRYINLLDGVQAFNEAYQRNVARLRAEQRTGEVRQFDREKVDGLLKQADAALASGDVVQGVVHLGAAQTIIAEAIRQMLEHQRLGETASWVVQKDELVASAKSQQQMEQADFQSALKALSSFKDAYQRNSRELREVDGAEAVVAYDAKSLAWLEAQASEFADKGKYREATMVLKRALNIVALPLHKMLDNHVILVKLDLSTPEKEFQYEANQYLGYEELIPVALKRMAADDEMRARVAALMAVARAMKQAADNKAMAGEYPDAIRLEQDATGKVQQALRMMGVPVYTSAGGHGLP